VRSHTSFLPMHPWFKLGCSTANWKRAQRTGMFTHKPTYAKSLRSNRYSPTVV